ncbi:MAG: DUF3617 domain-containing protein [Kangiellaceae bacterium]|nr:DUF3617 domain-containing protein [Kangiellaceae bacterium]
MKKYLVLATLGLGITSPLFANELKIKPGLWKSTTFTTNPVTQQEQKIEDEECITPDKATFSAETMMKDAPGECKTLNSNLSGDTLSFSIECSMQGGKTTVNGVFTVAGDKGNGKMDMQMEVAGQKMSMSSRMTSERVGECSK